MNNTSLLLDSLDNVGVALSDLAPGEQVELGQYQLQIREHVPAKHKFALQNFQPGDEIFMYGTVVAEVTQSIATGAALTVGNIRHKTQKYQLGEATRPRKSPDVSKWSSQTFLGFKREDGQVGTANYWLVLPMVFCENTNIKLLQEAFENALGFAQVNPYERQIKQLLAGIEDSMAPLHETSSSWGNERIFPQVDGIRFLTHTLGCGGTRDDADALCGLLAGYIHHPNVAGATVLSLGCQNAQVSILQEKLALHHICTSS